MRVSNHRLTMVELISALVLLGLAAAILFPYLNGVLSRTTAPVDQLRDLSGLLQVAERISSDYESTLDYRQDLALFMDKIVDGPNDYGSYDSATGEFITLDNGVEAPGTATDVLKITIRNEAAFFVLLFPYRAR